LSGGTLSSPDIDTGTLTYDSGTLTYTDILAGTANINTTLGIGTGKSLAATTAVAGTGTITLSGGTLSSPDIDTGTLTYDSGTLTYTDILAGTANINTTLGIGTGKTVTATTAVAGTGTITLSGGTSLHPISTQARLPMIAAHLPIQTYWPGQPI